MPPILTILLLFAAIIGLIAFIGNSGGDWRDRLTDALGAGFGGIVFLLLIFAQLALLVLSGWLAWKFLSWLLG